MQNLKELSSKNFVMKNIQTLKKKLICKYFFCQKEYSDKSVQLELFCFVLMKYKAKVKIVLIFEHNCLYIAYRHFKEFVKNLNAANVKSNFNFVNHFFSKGKVKRKRSKHTEEEVSIVINY